MRQASKKGKGKPKPTKLYLDVGCGKSKQTGFIGMDKRELDCVDIVHDCESFPWPIDDEYLDGVFMSHLVEHIKPWLTIDLMNECWRVLKPNGLLMISTPYGTSVGFYQDPTHCNPWTEITATYFIKGQPLYGIYEPKPWKDERIIWSKYSNLEIALRKVVD